MALPRHMPWMDSTRKIMFNIPIFYGTNVPSFCDRYKLFLLSHACVSLATLRSGFFSAICLEGLLHFFSANVKSSVFFSLQEPGKCLFLKVRLWSQSPSTYVSILLAAVFLVLWREYNCIFFFYFDSPQSAFVFFFQMYYFLSDRVHSYPNITASNMWVFPIISLTT